MRLLDRREALLLLSERSADAARRLPSGTGTGATVDPPRRYPRPLLEELDRELTRRIYGFLSRFDAAVEEERQALLSLLDEAAEYAPFPEDAPAAPESAEPLLELAERLRGFSGLIEEHASRQMFAFQAYFYFVLAAAVLSGAAVYGLRREARERRRAAERRRHLSRELIRLRDEQNRSLSAELHDTIAQELYSARLAAERNECDAAARRISSAVNMVRRLSHSLHGIDVSARGLTGSLQDLVTELSSIGSPRVDLEISGVEDEALSAGVQHELYHIAREATHNAIRHARAGRVEVRLTSSYPNVVLVIRDDGRGFDAARREPSEGIGLTTLEERAESIGASVTIESNPGDGTRVRVVATTEGGRHDEYPRRSDR